MKSEHLVNKTRGGVVVAQVVRPNGLLGLHLGLLVRAPLAAGEGLWLDPCGSIHTWGMGYAIDAVFLSADLRVLKTAANISPWRVVMAPKGCRSALEMRARSALPKVGDQLALKGARPEGESTEK